MRVTPYKPMEYPAPARYRSRFCSGGARLTCARPPRSIFVERVIPSNLFRREKHLEINDDAKEIVQELGAAINSAVENSSEVAAAIERLRGAGYEMELTLRLEIGLREHGGEENDDEDSLRLELTDEDRRTLRSMKIRFDDAE